MDKNTVVTKVREVAERVKGMEEVKDRAGRLTSVSEKTKADYEAVGAARLDLSQAAGGVLMEGVSARSWHHRRAALLWCVVRSYVMARRACDAAQRAGQWSQALEHINMASRALDAYTRIHGAARPPVHGPRQSKRKTLPKRQGWQLKAWQAATPAQRPALAVLWATGCRPAELAQGVRVTVQRSPDGKPVMFVTIPGAKVSEDRGQPVRVIEVDHRSPAGLALVQALKEARTGDLLVTRGADRLRKDMASLRASGAVPEGVSPYSYRHQVAADLKGAGWSPDRVAAVLGHLSELSQSRYGTSNQGKGSSLLDARASRPVRSFSSSGPSTGPDPSNTFRDLS